MTELCPRGAPEYAVAGYLCGTRHFPEECEHQLVIPDLFPDDPETGDIIDCKWWIKRNYDKRQINYNPPLTYEDIRKAYEELEKEGLIEDLTLYVRTEEERQAIKNLLKLKKWCL